jgi:hypothetical protein
MHPPPAPAKTNKRIGIRNSIFFPPFFSSAFSSAIAKKYYKIFHDGTIKEVDRRFLKRGV